jgi:hypothetical protein
MAIDPLAEHDPMPCSLATQIWCRGYQFERLGRACDRKLEATSVSEDSRIGASFDFDVAISFASPDREYVVGIVEQLKAEGVRVFYDSDLQSEMWGEDLVEYFTDVFQRRCRYAVIFISAHYQASMWTRLERRSALARALEQPGAYVLPVRLDDSALDGLLPTVAYLDARSIGVEGIVKSALAKLSGDPPAKGVAIERVPRSEIERQQILVERPPGWEHLYFAGCLLLERNLIEDRYRDHEMRYATRHGEPLDRGATLQFIKLAMGDARYLATTLDRVMNQDVQERAFGAPGVPGDPERLWHLASRWNSIYGNFIDWAAVVRGVRAPSEFSAALECLAQMADSPIATYRRFVDDFVGRMDELPRAIARGEPIVIEMTLKLDIPPETTAAFNAEMHRLKRR